VSAFGAGTLSVPGPTYDRSRVTTGVVHFGVGGFHRSHQAMYHDRLMNDGKALDWGICGVGVMPGDRDATHIVSLTVTEGGYNIHDVTGEFDAANPDVVHYLEPGATPRTTFALITEALRRRRERGPPPFTIMSCDNLQGNGHRSRMAFTASRGCETPNSAAGSSARSSPQLDGRPDHAGNHRCRPGRGARAVRHR
jgi:mannitol 2-dehydrogenase